MNTPREFQTFIAVDWSGAKGPRLPGLQVATCRPGRAAPRLETRAPSWTRQGVLDFLLDAAATRGPVLAGLDFGFAPPCEESGCYFPGLEASPPDAPALWTWIDRLAADAPDLYGAPAAQPPSPLAPLFNLPGHRGARFDNRRLRATERACPTRPSSVFNGVGPGSVGVGSLAGMRLLHRLRQAPHPRVAIWPFDPPRDADLVVVEIFPRLYARTTRFRPGDFPSEDTFDAVLSADALRRLARDPVHWNITAPREGWIFGVLP